MSTLRPLPLALYRPWIEAAFQEDLGRGGDLTSDALLDPSARAEGRVVARVEGVVCGVDAASEAFRWTDPKTELKTLVADGTRVGGGETVLEVCGEARALLAAERTALNFLGRLSGIATTTRRFVDRVADYGAKIACTRKTTPGWRLLEKYAVRAGGGINHRFGLDDAVMVKDNHLALVASVEEAVRRARAAVGHTVKIEVEVESLEQLEEALGAGADIVLLDNMGPPKLRRAVRQAAGRAVLEASGGVTLESVSEIAAAGVDIISIGGLTHSAPALDVSLELVAES